MSLTTARRSRRSGASFMRRPRRSLAPQAPPQGPFARIKAVLDRERLRGPQGPQARPATWRPAACLRVKSPGEPDARNPHVRFDERGEETERWPMAPKSPRLSSTLLEPTDPAFSRLRWRNPSRGALVAEGFHRGSIHPTALLRGLRPGQPDNAARSRCTLRCFACCGAGRRSRVRDWAAATCRGTG